MKGKSLTLQTAYRIACVIASFFKIGNHTSSLEGRGYYYTPQTNPLLLQTIRPNISTTTREYTDIGKHAALQNSAAFAFLPVHELPARNVRTIKIFQNYIGIAILVFVNIT